MSKATIKTVNGSTITIEKATEDKELLLCGSRTPTSCGHSQDENLSLLEIEKLYEHEINKKFIELLKEELDIYRKDIKELIKDLNLTVTAFGNLLYHCEKLPNELNASVEIAKISFQELMERKKKRDMNNFEEFDKDEF